MEREPVGAGDAGDNGNGCVGGDLGLSEFAGLGHGEALGLELAELVEGVFKSALLGGLVLLKVAEAGVGFVTEEGIDGLAEEFLFPLSEAAELPGGVQQVTEEFVF